MTRFTTLIVMGLAAALLAPREVCAQSADAARIHLGPLGLKPRIALTGLGIDTNVDNTASNPENDLTTTLVPGLDSFLPIGVRGLLSGKTSYELLYFKKNAGRRAANLSQSGRFDYSFIHFAPHVEVDYRSTNQRPNPEVDLRVHQVTKDFGVGTLVKFGPRTNVDLSFARSRLSVADEQFLGVDLGSALSRHSDTFKANFTRALTTLTTFTVNTTLQHDRFDGSSLRNGDTLAITSGFQFKPLALFSGGASVGLQGFRPLDPTVKPFTGLIAAVNLNYVMRDSTKFGVVVNRGLEYSIDADAPYYVLTDATFNVTQRVRERWDVTGRFGRSYLDYRSVVKSTEKVSMPRRDRIVMYGLGGGFRITPDTRAGVAVDYERRMSPVDLRQYDGYRFGGTFTYAY